MKKKERDEELGYLFVVGGPGGSGATVISKMLAEHFNLDRIYAGAFFREEVLEKGYKDFEDFYTVANKHQLLEMDERIDRKMIIESQKKDVLIDSKIFAGIAHIKDIACTAKIWIEANLHTRALRHLNKEDYVGLDRVRRYLQTRRNLRKRRNLDKERYASLYGIDYNKPELYNDIVIDSSNQNEYETFNLLLKKLKDGGYIKKQ